MVANPRRSLSVGLIVYALVTALRVTPTTAQTCPHDGDVNQDGSITPADAFLALQHFLGIAAPPLSTCAQERANVNDPQGSGVTPADALCLFQRFLGLASCFDPLAPVGISATIETSEDTPFNGILRARDANGDSLTFRIVTNGTLGTATLTDATTGAFTYTPNANATGTDTFQFVANDGVADSPTTTVTVNIVPVSDAPVARDDTEIGTGVNTPVTITVLVNDEDPDGDVLTVIAVTPGAQGGSVTTNGTTVTYAPALNFVGRDTFTYTVSDGQGGTATATVTVEVTSTNNSPVVQDDTSITDEGVSVAIAVLANDTDPDGNTLSIAEVIPSTTANGGTATINGPNIIYTPPGGGFNGTDSFSYRACDNGTPVLCGTAQVTVTINVVNIPPSVASPIADIVVNEDAPNTVLNLANTFSDPDLATGDRLTLSVVGNTNPMLLTATVMGTQLILTYLRDRNGEAFINVRATDLLGGSVDDTFRVTVTPVPDDPRITQPPAPRTNIVGRRITPFNLRQAMLIEDAEDGDCAACTITVSNLPPNLIKADTDFILGIVAFNAFSRGEGGGPIYPVTVTVTDRNGGKATGTFEWRVSQGGVDVVNPGESGEGDGDGDGDSADGDGGAGGDASDGGDASPLARAMCTFVDMNGIPFTDSTKQVIQTTAGEDGKFLLRIPADPTNPGFVMDWQGFVECHPPDKPDLVVSTYLNTKGIRRGERLTGLKVDPMTTVSRLISDGLNGANAATDLVAINARLRDEVDGLKVVSPQEKDQRADLSFCTGEETVRVINTPLSEGSLPGDNRTGIAAYASSQLFLGVLKELEGRIPVVDPDMTTDPENDRLNFATCPLPSEDEAPTFIGALSNYLQRTVVTPSAIRELQVQDGNTFLLGRCPDT